MKDGKFELLSRINDEDISSRFFPTKEIDERRAKLIGIYFALIFGRLWTD